MLTWIPTTRKCLLVAAVASLLAAAPPAASLQTTAHDGCDANRHASPADDVSLRAVASAWKDAYNAGHAERVSSLYTNDGQYLSAHVHARGREAIRAYFQRGIDAGGHIEGIRVLDTKSNGNLAYAVGTYDANNAGQRVDGRLLLVLENCDGGWRIAAHEVVVRDQP